MKNMNLFLNLLSVSGIALGMNKQAAKADRNEGLQLVNIPTADLVQDMDLDFGCA